ncbi:MAG: hypothetical protein ACREJC_16650 [Tepidisphaeraceae bacterium]
MSRRKKPAKSVLRHCAAPEDLHSWVRQHLKLDIPRAAVCAGHDAPLDYLWHAYHEPSRDVVIWAPRGGGKTRLAAIATLLDLLHKPGVVVRILGGSLEQSMRVWEHLLEDLKTVAPGMIQRDRSGARRITLDNGSTAAVLTQSQRAVRGLRVQKLRCDEVEMFRPEIWEAAQLITRSTENARGTVEAISTLHLPYGMMSRVVDKARENGTRVIRWCLLEVLERCPSERDCKTCPLWDECRGIAKTRCDGFVSIDDAIAMKKRVSLETWNAEMLCQKPSAHGCVFPTFDEQVHVVDNSQPTTHDSQISLAIDFGYAAPFVCLWIESRGEMIHVIDEYVQPQRTIHEHIDQIQARRWGKVRTIACDPSGAGRNDQTATSNVAILRRAGFSVRTRRSGILAGLDMIRTALRPATGPARLFIHPRCARLIKAMRAYHYAPSGSELPVKDGEHDHLIDALRYWFVNLMTSAEVKSKGY